MTKISTERKYVDSEEKDNEGKDEEPDPCGQQAVLNAFVHDFSLNTWYDIFKMGIMSVTILPLRILMILILLPIGFIVTKIGTFGMSREDFMAKPLVGFRRALRWCMGFLGRMLMRCYAFHWVKIKGRLASREEAPIIVVAPHSTFLDGIAVFWSDLPSLVSRIENLQLPFFGRYIDYTQPIYVHRDDSTSRQNSKTEIRERSKTKEDWPRIIIYPEGTCTNRSCLITFKAGAFYPGVPVQPLIIRYPNVQDCITWTWDGPGTFKTIWTTLCQFHNYCELEYLPVYRPSQEEIDNPYLYASNVRQVMADALGVPVADYTYDDCRIMHKARLRDLPSETGLIEFQKLRKSLGNMTLTDVDEYLSYYAVMALTDGKISLRDFSTFLGVPFTEPTLVELFNLYDKNGCGLISFRDYLSYRYVLINEASSEETITLAFKLLDAKKENKITLENFTKILNSSVGMATEFSSKIFEEVDHDTKGFLTIDDFHLYAKNKPEYAKLFLLYQKSLQDGTRAAALSTGVLSNGLHKTKFE